LTQQPCVRDIDSPRSKSCKGEYTVAELLDRSSKVHAFGN